MIYFVVVLCDVVVVPNVVSITSIGSKVLWISSIVLCAYIVTHTWSSCVNC